MILLLQPEFGMHYPIGELAVVREQEQPLGVAIEPADRVEPLGRLHQLHDRRAVAVIAGCRYESTGLIEHHIAAALRTHHLAIDSDLVIDRIGFGSELRHGRAVHGNAARDDHLLGDAS